MADNPLYKTYSPAQIEFLPVESASNEGYYQIAVRGWPFTVLQFYKNGTEYDETDVTKLITKLEEDFLTNGKFNPKDWSPNPNITQVSGGGLIGDVINVFTNKYSRETEKILSKYGKYRVRNVKVVRDPVDAPIRAAIDKLTKGQQLDYQKAGYDYLFHLYMIIECVNMGDVVYLLTEKRPNIIWEKRKSLDSNSSPKSQYIKFIAPLDPVSYTVADMIGYAKRVMGSKFNTYDAATNNCQDYIVALVNGLGFSGFNEFIKQPVEDLIETLGPSIVKGAKFLTDTAHFFGRVTGKGVNMKKKIIPKVIEQREPTGSLNELNKFVKKFGSHIVTEVTIAHYQYDAKEKTYINTRKYVELIREEKTNAIIRSIVVIQLDLDNGVSILTRKFNNGQPQFSFGAADASNSLTIDVDDDTTFAEALNNTTIAMSSKQYAKNILKNLNLSEYFNFVDNGGRPDILPKQGKEFGDNILSLDDAKINEQRDLYKRSGDNRRIIDPFKQERTYNLQNSAAGRQAKLNAYIDKVRLLATNEGVGLPVEDAEEIAKKLIKRDEKDVDAVDYNEAIGIKEFLDNQPIGLNAMGFGVMSSKTSDALSKFLMQRGDVVINSVGVSPLGTVNIGLPDGEFTLFKNTKSDFQAVKVLDAVDLSNQMPLLKPITINGLLANTKGTSKANFSRQVLKNIFNNQFTSRSKARGGGASDKTASVSVDILSNVEEALKDVPEIGSLVDLANEAGDLISKGTLALFGIKGPYKQISKSSDLQLLPLNEYGLTDQLIWRVFNVGVPNGNGTTAAGFKPENYPILTLPENHPANILQEQITLAHGH